MQTLITGEMTSQLSNIGVTKEGIELLEELAKIVNIDELMEVSISTSSLDCLKYTLPNDLCVLDIPWLCVPLFSSVLFTDFCWLISALVQEKSIIFASYNLGLVTSCVLAMRALIRPLNWISLTIPLIPDDLRELLEAPVPVLAGITHIEAKLRHKFPNIIWVLLDEQAPKHRVQFSSGLVNEVTEIDSQISNTFKNYYTFDSASTFDKTKESQENAVKISKTLQKYWQGILDKFSSKTIKDPKTVKKICQYPSVHADVREFF
jgi:hypothetical protein